MPFGPREQACLCGLVAILFAAACILFFWHEIDALVRANVPGWPYVLGLPILSYAYVGYGGVSQDRGSHRGSVPAFASALLRANLPVRVGSRTFRLYLFCHGNPDRCLHVRGHRMPVCARCTGLLLGIPAGIILPVASVLMSSAATGLGILLIGPILVDGFTQLAGLRRSTNALRLATGIVAGFGLAIVVGALRGALPGA